MKPIIVEKDANWATHLGDRPLNPSKEKQLFEAIVKFQLDPLDFDRELGGSNGGSPGMVNQTVPLWSHRPTKSYFMFDGSTLHTPERVVEDTRTNQFFVSRFHPGVDGHPESTEYGLTWSSQFTHFTTWLSLVKKEDEIDDPWEALAASMADDTDPWARTEEKFSPEERARIASSLRLIAKRLKEVSPTAAEEPQRVDATMDYLERASGRLGKLDWWYVTRTAVAQLTVRFLLEKAGFNQFMNFAFKEITSAVVDGRLLVEEVLKCITSP
jgi:hypothetical protein